MKDSTQRSRTAIELIDAIVACDDRTRRTVILIATLVSSMACVGGLTGVEHLPDAWTLPCALVGLAWPRTRRGHRSC